MLVKDAHPPSNTRAISSAPAATVEVTPHCLLPPSSFAVKPCQLMPVISIDDGPGKQNGQPSNAQHAGLELVHAKKRAEKPFLARDVVLMKTGMVGSLGVHKGT